jgi:TonB family protein
MHSSYEREGFVFTGQGFKRARKLFGVSVLLFSFLGAAPAQDQEQARKVVAKAAPFYPEMARKMHLTGKVKLEVAIAAHGSVTAARLIGGNPVFEKSAVDAVKQWRFEPADKETKAVVVLEFAEQ